MTDLRINLTSGDWLDWLKNPVTQEGFKVIQEEREDWTMKLVAGLTLMEPHREIAETAKHVGIIAGLDFMPSIGDLIREQEEEDGKPTA